jgi:hypothetical protein
LDRMNYRWHANTIRKKTMTTTSHIAFNPLFTFQCYMTYAGEKTLYANYDFLESFTRLTNTAIKVFLVFFCTSRKEGKSLRAVSVNLIYKYLECCDMSLSRRYKQLGDHTRNLTAIFPSYVVSVIF